MSCTQALGREAILGGARGNPAENTIAQRQQRAGVGKLALDPVREQTQRRTQVADHFGLREIHLFHVRGLIAHVHHLRTARPHDEWRLLDGVMTDAHDEIGAVDGLVHVIAFGERGGAHVQLRAAGHGALAHLGREVRNPRAQHELREIGCRAWPRRRGAYHDQRPLRRHDQSGGTVEGRSGGDRQFHRMRVESAWRLHKLPRRCPRAAPGAPGPAALPERCGTTRAPTWESCAARRSVATTW